MKKRLLYIRVVALSALLLLSVASETSLARSPGESLKEQMLRAGQLAAIDGYRFSNELSDIDVLEDDAKETYTMRLNKNSTYKIIGVCDDDCDDLDLILYDENNNLIDQDKRRDSIPMVDVKPKWSGNFRLEVRMASCRTRNCAYGLLTMKK